jgi:hypothetical protein
MDFGIEKIFVHEGVEFVHLKVKSLQILPASLFYSSTTQTILLTLLIFNRSTGRASCCTRSERWWAWWWPSCAAWCAPLACNPSRWHPSRLDPSCLHTACPPLPLTASHNAVPALQSITMHNEASHSMDILAGARQHAGRREAYWFRAAPSPCANGTELGYSN